MPNRKVLDQVVNCHGQCLIEFLQESAMCLLNGRLNVQHDDYTLSATRGKSVVDYIMVTHQQLGVCTDFSVTSCYDVVNELHLAELIGPKSRLSYHAIIKVTFDMPVVSYV